MSFFMPTILFAFGLSTSALVTPFPSHGHNDTDLTCPGPILPQGSGPVPDHDTPEAFLGYDVFGKAAVAATAPSGFTRVFYNAKAAIESPDYLTYYELKSYDVSACEEYCDITDHCNTFNIFFERTPKVDPNDKCKNPPSTTLIKCSLFSSSVVNANVSNDGQYRGDFHVVITGSNGYLRDPEDDCPGYKLDYFGHSAIGATVDCKGSYTYMGYKVYDASTYSLARCAKACSDQNEYNIAHPPTDGTEVQLCHFTNSYIEKKNGVPTGQYCALYSKAWHRQQATNDGQYRGGDIFTIEHSIGLRNVTGNYDACV
jgi:hypothetical protein